MKKFGRRPDDQSAGSPLAVPAPEAMIPLSTAAMSDLASATPIFPFELPDEPASASGSSLSTAASPDFSPKRGEPVVHHPVISSALRERVIEQIEPSAAATVSREVLRRQIEEIIHGIANK